jgi:hypothetical protein
MLSESSREKDDGKCLSRFFDNKSLLSALLRNQTANFSLTSLMMYSGKL